MSSLAAVVGPAGAPACPQLLLGMLHAMHRREPVGRFVEVRGDATIGYGGQERCGVHLGPRGAVLLDGRLDNRTELIAALDIEDGRVGDARLISAAYDKWSDGLAEHLLGDFAILVIDGARRRVLAVRDHFGVKPLYYARQGERVLFASEQQALLAAGVSADVSTAAVVNFLAGTVGRPEQTNFEQIACVPPASLLVIDSNGLSARSYWRLEPSLPEPPEQDAAERLKLLLQQAVSCRLPKNAAYGVMLSGGLDSSSLAGLARADPANHGRLIDTYSSVYDGTPEHNERPYIEAVLAQSGFNPHFIAADDIPPFEGYSEMITQHGGPPIGPNTAAARQVYATAARDGLRVLIDGHGGDEVVSHGHGKLLDLIEAGRLWECWLELDALRRIEPFNAGAAYMRMLLDFGLRPKLHALPGWPKARARRRPEPDPLGMIRPSIIDEFGLADPRGRFRERLPGRTFERSQHFITLTNSLQAKAFELLDSLAARYSIEARYPFWDKRVVEFCLSLPPDAKFKRGVTRRVLRGSMSGVVPDMILERHVKFDFTARIVAPLLAHHEPMIRRVLSDDSRLERFLDMDALRRAHERLKAGSAKGFDFQWVWRAVSCSQWLDWIESNKGRLV